MRRLLAFALLLVAAPAAAEMHMNHGGNGACAGIALACAATATPVVAPDGSLYAAWATADHVAVARSRDNGRSFSEPVAVNPEGAKIDPGPDARPSIAIGADGKIFVAYTVFAGTGYIGRVYIAHSQDGGLTFAPPQPITDDTASQRFTRLIFDKAGTLFAVWIDKREVAAARAAGKAYPGAALAVATWDGTGFTPARIAQSDSCECCRVAAALDTAGHPVVAFRNVFDATVRDHAVVRFDGKGRPGPIHRVSIDDWRTDVCPHQGPDIAVGPDGAYHVAWFTQGKARQGLFYARSTDAGVGFSAPMPIGDPDKAPSRPRVLAVGKTVWLAWKEFDGKVSTVRARHSPDGGKRWDTPVTIAETKNASDQPMLLAEGGRAYLSWLTHDEGYRLIALEEKP
ncbi:MAG TPA: sialidase family protein [Alphaproteobacteria bacterium]|nr:sialidase family protein [Alphaproteobacteria bacterium]